MLIHDVRKLLAAYLEIPCGYNGRPDAIGEWESSGILDVTHLFDSYVGERVLLATVQATTIHDGLISKSQLVEGGPFILLRKPMAVFPERADR